MPVGRQEALIVPPCGLQVWPGAVCGVITPRSLVQHVNGQDDTMTAGKGGIKTWQRGDVQQWKRIEEEAEGQSLRCQMKKAGKYYVVQGNVKLSKNTGMKMKCTFGETRKGGNMCRRQDGNYSSIFLDANDGGRMERPPGLIQRNDMLDFFFLHQIV